MDQLELALDEQFQKSRQKSLEFERQLRLDYTPRPQPFENALDRERDEQYLATSIVNTAAPDELIEMH